MSPLPHNLLAEQGLLGALLFDNRLRESLPPVRADHFFDPVHGRIFAEIERVCASGISADAVSLREWALRDRGVSELGAGGSYLLHLLDRAAPLAAQACGYAEIIIDMANRRRVIEVCQSVIADAARGERSAEEVLASAGRDLEGAFTSQSAGTSLRAAAALAVANAQKGARGIPTGFAALDARIGGLFAPDVIVLAGRPSMGKTSLAANIAHSVALRDYVVHFASNEMSAEQIAQRALSRASYGGADQFQYRAFRRGGLPIASAKALAERMPESLVIDDSGGQTLAHLRSQARATRRSLGGLDLIVIDYLQLMRDEAVKRGETAEITALTKGIKQMAKDFGVPIILLSQLSRDVERRDDKRPTLSDLRQSGSIEQDADVVLFAFREHYYLSRAEPRREDGESNHDFDARYHKWCDDCEETSGKMEVIAAKTRMDETGSAFLTVDLGYDVAADPQQAPGRAYHSYHQ